MFLGHFAVALAAKRKARRASLGTLFAAAQALDLVWPVLVLAGIEAVRVVPGAADPFLRLEFVRYPYSHSLVGALVIAAGFAAVYAWRRGDAGTAGWLGAVVASHWVLDWITHVPDLALAPGLGARVGLGLWRQAGAAVAVELGMFAAGVWVYARATRARNRRGSVVFWALAAALPAIYLASVLGPAPASGRAVAFSALAMWLLVAWGAWADHLRAPRAASGH